jgi:NADPH:quinone reductase-like Zn-dependent oxidoreductase
MNLAEMTVLVTGSTDGVGKLVAQRLAQAGAHVLLHGRSREKGQRVLAEIRAASGSERLEFHLADLASLRGARPADMVSVRHERPSAHQRRHRLRPAGHAREVSRDGLSCASPSTICRAFLTQLLPRRLRAARRHGSSMYRRRAIRSTSGCDAGARLRTRATGSKLRYVAIDLAEQPKGAGITVTRLHRLPS